MNEVFERKLYCGRIRSWNDGSVDNLEIEEKGFIAINISDIELAKYHRHNIKIKIEVVEDLGLDPTLEENNGKEKTKV